MPVRESLRERRVVRVRRVGATNSWRTDDRVRENAASRESPGRRRATTDEGDDGAQDFRGSGEIALVHAQLTSAITHHHRTVPREATAIDAHEPERSKPGQQFRRISRRRIEREIELVLRPREKAA